MLKMKKKARGVSGTVSALRGGGVGLAEHI